MVGNEYWGYVVIRREEGKFCVVGNEYWGYVVIRRERGKCCVVGNEYLRIAAKMRSVRIRVKDSNW